MRFSIIISIFIVAMVLAVWQWMQPPDSSEAFPHELTTAHERYLAETDRALQAFDQTPAGQKLQAKVEQAENAEQTESLTTRKSECDSTGGTVRDARTRFEKAREDALDADPAVRAALNALDAARTRYVAALRHAGR